MLDIRLPIGIMFSLIGLVLTVFGAVTPGTMYTISLGHNLNLYWGLAMLGFGVVMLLASRFGPKDEP